MTATVSTVDGTSKSIPFVEPWIDDGLADAVAAQVRSGFIGPGRRTKEFAEAIASHARVQRVVLTTSGTVALSVAATTIGLVPGDEILIPAYGVIATVNAFASIGLRPRLVDIDIRTGCMNPDHLESLIRPDTKAVCFVNFSGNTGPELQSISEICARRGLPLIEDAAGALGHSYDGRAAGTFGTVGTYSFSVPKILTTGQGGALLFNDDVLAAKATSFIDHGDPDWRRTNINPQVGTNLRFNDILAALGIAQLQTIDRRLEAKRRAHSALRQHLGANLWSVHGPEAPLHNIVFCQQSDHLVSMLKQHGVQAVRQYRTISQHPAYAHLADRSYPAADWWTDFAVYLPFGVAMTEADADAIGTSIRHTGLTLTLPA